MNRESLLTLLLGLLLLLSGCHDERRLYLLSYGSEVLLPLKACHFTGCFDREELSVRAETARTPAEFIRLLNFSKYSAVIATGGLADRLTSLSGRWKKVCLVAVKKERSSPIREGKYYLLVREDLLYDTERLVKLVKGWNYGVDLLKDGAVVYYLTGSGEVRGLKFLKCKGTDED